MPVDAYMCHKEAAQAAIVYRLEQLYNEVRSWPNELLRHNL